ncbi:MAG: hypothetical protein QOH81_2261 [Sphingomonadales bacterium]|jgi:hypothetical protein|nr:hypothetical protein [Sphingomonadales bacterium]
MRRQRAADLTERRRNHGNLAAAGPLTLIEISIGGIFPVNVRQKNPPPPNRAAAAARPDGRRGRGEAARRALAEGIERSRRLVDRYRALLVRLHDPIAGARAEAGSVPPPGPRRLGSSR